MEGFDSEDIAVQERISHATLSLPDRHASHGEKGLLSLYGSCRAQNFFFPNNAWCLLNVVRKEENKMVLIWEGYKLEKVSETRQKIAEHVEVSGSSQANSLSINLIHTSAA